MYAAGIDSFSPALLSKKRIVPGSVSEPLTFVGSSIKDHVSDLYEEAKAYTNESELPTYTTPPATAGEEITSPPVLIRHKTVPLSASRAYTNPSLLPTKISPSTTATEDKISAPDSNRQR
jgi:hypothetical protein